MPCAVACADQLGGKPVASGCTPSTRGSATATGASRVNRSPARLPDSTAIRCGVAGTCTGPRSESTVRVGPDGCRAAAGLAAAAAGQHQEGREPGDQEADPPAR